jgi:hypothetical protein
MGREHVFGVDGKRNARKPAFLKSSFHPDRQAAP